MEVTRDFEEFFASFNAHNVQYLVVGGYAIALHARPRYTGDMDVFVSRNESNAKNIALALVDFGFRSPQLPWSDFSAPGRVIQIGYPPNRIDIVTSIDGVEFDQAWERRVAATYGAQTVHFISKADLVANKRASGRPQDLSDLDTLTKG
ncbi:MAG TPA: DUF6036 family nucleotidyltransferase [Bacteroidota bacterium]|nr:DUF6036 family nucleotidyltransferase [Bacteroidota bacterium]